MTASSPVARKHAQSGDNFKNGARSFQSPSRSREKPVEEADTAILHTKTSNNIFILSKLKVEKNLNQPRTQYGKDL